jgi:plasmid replication initiation protein
MGYKRKNDKNSVKNDFFSVKGDKNSVKNDFFSVKNDKNSVTAKSPDLKDDKNSVIDNPPDVKSKNDKNSVENNLSDPKNDKNSVKKKGAEEKIEQDGFVQFIGKGPPMEDLIVKSNRLVEARYRLSLQEQKIILTMISKIGKDDEDFKTINFNVREFAELIGVRPDSYYNELKQITKGLLEKALIIRSEKRELQVGWLSSAEYYEGKGLVELEFSPKMKPYLLQLRDAFIKYQLKNVLPLRSTYSIRIYELLKQYENIGKRTFTLNDFRTIIGISSEKLTRFHDLKKRVLLKAQQDLKNHTDISFTFHVIKAARKVSSIEFIIKSQKLTIETKCEEGADIHSLFDLVPDQHRVKKTVQAVIEKYFEKQGFNYVQRNIIYTNKELKDQRKYRAYLEKSLKGDWGKGFLEDIEAEKAQREFHLKAEAEEKIKYAEYEAKAEQERQEKERLRKQCQALLDGLPDERCKELESGFVDTLNEFNLGRYKKYGLNHPKTSILKGCFLDYCIEKLKATDENQTP